MKKLKKLPIGIQSFEFIRQNLGEFVYVDKTQQIYNILCNKFINLTF